ncbi:uncharacterized protein LOC142979572 [Anticarsia gemmatalis]|uniref:uncharacterized protein LOC142979572 n=1 Tax=Anticarsia gemmatalis TaxID=129554 RepID=UPI003F76187C
MRLLIVPFFFSVLSCGNLQEVDHAEYDKFPANPGVFVPVAEDSNWPVKAYQTFQTNFYGTARRSIKTKPCPLQSNSQNVASEKTLDNQIELSPSRRSYSVLDRIFKNYGMPRPQVKPEHLTLRTITTEKNSPSSEANSDGEVFYEANDSAGKRSSIENADSESESVEITLTPIVEGRRSENQNIPVATEYVVKSATQAPMCPQKESEASRRYITKPNNPLDFQKYLSDNAAQANSNIAGTRYLNQNNNVPRTDGKDEKAIANSQSVVLSHAGKQINNVEKFSNGRPNPPPEKAPGQAVNYDNELKDPTKGHGISVLQKSNNMFIDSDRICYACSSANNFNCFEPDRRTTVKYCRKGTNGCMTKTYEIGGKLTLIRDCAKSCDDAEISGLTPKYKSCSICHSDLCNSAYTANVHSLILTLPIVTLIALIKPLI